MQIGIIGCGAMGSIYAGLLASSGNNVLVVDSNKDHIRAIELNVARGDGKILLSDEYLARTQANDNRLVDEAGTLSATN
mgnify:CR=1 FL=1